MQTSRARKLLKRAREDRPKVHVGPYICGAYTPTGMCGTYHGPISIHVIRVHTYRSPYTIYCDPMSYRTYTPTRIWKYMWYIMYGTCTCTCTCTCRLLHVHVHIYIENAIGAIKQRVELSRRGIEVHRHDASTGRLQKFHVRCGNVGAICGFSRSSFRL